MHDDGTGPALYLAGQFEYAATVEAHCIIRWDGQSWSDVGIGLFGEFDQGVLALTVFDDGRGPALWVGGSFLTAGGKPSVDIARWGCAANWLPDDLNCDGTADRRDINPFVQALSDAGKYQTIYPDCLLLNADLNGNGSVGFDDINPYVELLLGFRP